METLQQVPVLTQQWDLGYEIGMIITIILTAGSALFAVGAFITAMITRGNRGVGPGLIAVIVMLVAGFIGTIVAWPFSGQYHRYQPLGGTVASISSRLIASGTNGGGSTQKFVFTFAGGTNADGSRPALGCNDTRCSAVHVGDKVMLMCERSYQWNAPTQGWDCNWGYDEQPARNGNPASVF